MALYYIMCGNSNCVLTYGPMAMCRVDIGYEKITKVINLSNFTNEICKECVATFIHNYVPKCHFTKL